MTKTIRVVLRPRSYHLAAAHLPYDYRTCKGANLENTGARPSLRFVTIRTITGVLLRLGALVVPHAPPPTCLFAPFHLPCGVSVTSVATARLFSQLEPSVDPSLHIHYDDPISNPFSRDGLPRTDNIRKCNSVPSSVHDQSARAPRGFSVCRYGFALVPSFGCSSSDHVR